MRKVYKVNVGNLIESEVEQYIKTLMEKIMVKQNLIKNRWRAFRATHKGEIK